MAETVVRWDKVEPEPLVLEGAPGHGLADVHEAHPADGGRNSAVGGSLKLERRFCIEQSKTVKNTLN